MPDENIQDDLDTVLSVIATIRDGAFQHDKVDFRLVYQRPENYRFVKEHRIGQQDIREMLGRLRPEEYSHTSRETGKNDAYVFGVDIDDVQAYLKISVVDNIIIISLHGPDRELLFPFRRSKK